MRVERARYLLAAVDRGSLRAAAASLGVSQPTVGEQIMALEEELNVTLLARGRHGVTATQAGLALVPLLKALVAAEEALLERGARLTDTYEGVVGMGMVPVMAGMFGASAIADLVSQHPGLRFTLVEGSTFDLEHQVAAGSLDLAVATGCAELTQPRDVLRTALFALPIGVYVTGEHPLLSSGPLTWEQLEPWPLVTMQKGTTLWEVLHARVQDPQIVVAAASQRTVQLMSARGIGVGIGSEPEGAGQSLPGLRWLPLKGEAVDVFLSQRRGTQLSRAAVVVRQLMPLAARGWSESS